jgi:hypothetical protein
MDEIIEAQGWLSIKPLTIKSTAVVESDSKITITFNHKGDCAYKIFVVIVISFFIG